MNLAYFWLMEFSHTQIIQMTNHSATTLTSFFAFFRQLVAEDIDEHREVIGGENIVVEIDESKFAKRKYHRGHRVGDGS